MEELVLRPLHLGTIRRDKSIFTYLRNMGTQIEMPILAWYIEGQGHRILVDTGGHDPAKGELHSPYMREPGQDPVSRLAALGVRPEDIDILILTHLHWDHASNIDLFPKARVIVQREELRYAAAPLDPHRWAYQSIPPFLQVLERIDLIEGDKEIARGVSVHLTPGHTPGIQGVAVRVPGRRYFIAGDNVPLMENWDAKGKYGVPHWPNSIHVDLEIFLKTLRRIEDLGDIILPGHDWSALEKTEYK
jgi:glyoxylase-like metal-dependent hydrolase (beta-lactamase superfamily II)